jgi:hypothetical protein
MTWPTWPYPDDGEPTGRHVYDDHNLVPRESVPPQWDDPVWSGGHDVGHGEPEFTPGREHFHEVECGECGGGGIDGWGHRCRVCHGAGVVVV